MLLKFLQRSLAFIARKIIKKHQPTIVGITGSVGKSSAKQVVALILKNQMNIRESKGNYNNEIGVPLTIIGVRSPGRNVIGWIKVFVLGFLKIILKDKSYPRVLVLEMAADRPGDIKYLLEMAPCTIGVLTAIDRAHTEFFKNIENVAKEKSAIILDLPSDGWAILNADDKRIMELKNRTSARVLTYGLSPQADIQALEVALEQELKPEGPEIKGLRFKVSYQGNVVPIFLPEIVSLSQVYAILVGLAVGLSLGLNLIDMSQTLRKYKTLPGRMNLIPGVNKSLIIDDSYNSSPRAVEAALETLERIEIHPQASKWIILGDMLELGDLSQKAHYQVGEKIARKNFDYLIAVGREARAIVQGVRENGFVNENVFSFENSLAVCKFLKPRIKTGDVILVKGSRKMRMEKLVKEIMLQPRLAKRYLVR